MPDSVAARPVPPLLDLEVLRTFIAIAETGSFTRAAVQVHRTPSAVSMQIKRLEEMLGAILLLRQSKSAVVTPEGEALLGCARRMLKLNEDAVSRFISPALTGSVRIGTSDDVGTRILPGVLSSFARAYPSVQVDVVVGRSIDMLASVDDGTLDLALITAGHGVQRGEPVFTEQLIWAEAVGGQARARRPLPLSLAAPGCVWRESALAALDRADFAYRVAYTSEHPTGQSAAILADLAVAPFPRGLISKPLKEVDAEAGLPALGGYQVMLVQGDDQGPLINELRSYIKEAFAGLKHLSGRGA